LERLEAEVVASVFIETAGTADQAAHVPFTGERARRGNLVTAELPITELRAAADDPSVTWVEVGESLAIPRPVVSTASVRPPSRTTRSVAGDERHHGGEGVLIGIIDVNGFDFAHPDFLDDHGNTRWVRIWDQGGDARPNPHDQDPARYEREFAYGSELRAEHLNAAIAAAPGAGVAAQDIEPQSQMEPGSHGTHVSSIAAGNLGVCPRARIAGVLISLPRRIDRRCSFYDSTRIARCRLPHNTRRQAELPVSINVVVGRTGMPGRSSAADR
jgi:subtilisin family serine protease